MTRPWSRQQIQGLHECTPPQTRTRNPRIKRAGRPGLFRQLVSVNLGRWSAGISCDLDLSVYVAAAVAAPGSIGLISADSQNPGTPALSAITVGERLPAGVRPGKRTGRARRAGTLEDLGRRPAPHRLRAEWVLWARPGARFSRDSEDQVGLSGPTDGQDQRGPAGAESRSGFQTRA
jgi:hypothetical protein